MQIDELQKHNYYKNFYNYMSIDFYKFIEDINKEPEPSPLSNFGEPPVKEPTYNYTQQQPVDYYKFAAEAPMSRLPTKYSLSQLEKDPEFSFRAKRFLDGIGRNENIFEFLRDTEFSLSSAISRSFEVGKWSPQEKEDYVYLRNKFNGAELRGFKERFNLVKNIGGDILGDPLNYLAAFFAIPTLGGSLAGRAALGKAAEVGVKKYTTSQLAKRGALLGAAEGAAFTGPHEYFLQDIDVDLGARDSLDLSLVGQMGLMGAGFGGLLGGAIGGVTGLYGRRFDKKEYTTSNEEVIEKQGAGKGARKEAVETSETERSFASNSNNMLNKIFAQTTGKPTTWFLGYVSKSPALKRFLESLRYDYDSTLTSTGRKGVKEETYGEYEGNLLSKLQYALHKSLNRLYTAENGLNKLGPKENDDLLKLLQNENITRDNISKVSGQYSENVIRAYMGIRELLDFSFDEANKFGLFSAGVVKLAGYFPRHFRYEVVDKKRPKLEKLIIESGHADPLNEPITKRIIDAETNEIRKGVLIDANGTDEEIFGINFLKEAGYEGKVIQDGKKKITIYNAADASQEQLTKAKELKATKIVDDMLEHRWTPFELKSARAKSSKGFLQERRFRNISDEDLSEFLEGDVQLVLENYITTIAKSTARAKFFGKTADDFEKNFIKNTANKTGMFYELQSAGMSDTDIKKILDRVRYTRKVVTGEENFSDSVLRDNPYASFAADWGKVIQQMAHLPVATLSSVTEPLLLLQRAGLDDAPNVLKDIANGIIAETNNTVNRVGRALSFTSGKIGISSGTNRNIIKSLGEAPTVKDFKKGASIFDTMDDDVWGEMYQTNLALEQAVIDRIEGLAGEGVKGKVAKNVQNAFFKANLLTQWTRAVQLAAFTTGKRLIVKNARQLANNKTDLGRKLTKSNKEYLIRQLNELNINENEAIAFYKNSLDKDGRYSIALAKKYTDEDNINFYNEKLTKAAGRFTREIILNPSSAQANRPLWFSTPAAQLLIQFAGYPTVFNNTILKRFSNELFTSPAQTIPKLVPTVLLMTSVAHLGNTIRSNGQNLRDYETGALKSEGELLGEAIRRWGGYGPFDYASRWNNEYDRNVGGFTATAKAFAGPLPQDAIDAILYRKGLAEVAATNLPGYGAYDILFGEGTKKEIRRIARGSKSKSALTEAQARKVGTYYAKGGIVTNVPRVPIEPDERKDRMTGVPYDEQAGIIMEDEEEK